ncbi:MAG: hypothetical protein HYX39_01420 [Bacteroidetes bacterium]|nr:hypothetical protein [Bacteroidota bacterium]
MIWQLLGELVGLTDQGILFEMNKCGKSCMNKKVEGLRAKIRNLGLQIGSLKIKKINPRNKSIQKIVSPFDYL